MKTLFDGHWVSHIERYYEIKVFKILLNSFWSHLPQIFNNFYVLRMLPYKLSEVLKKVNNYFIEKLNNNSRLFSTY